MGKRSSLVQQRWINLFKARSLVPGYGTKVQLRDTPNPGKIGQVSKNEAVCHATVREAEVSRWTFGKTTCVALRERVADRLNF